MYCTNNYYHCKNTKGNPSTSACVNFRVYSSSPSNTTTPYSTTYPNKIAGSFVFSNIRTCLDEGMPGADR